MCLRNCVFIVVRVLQEVRQGLIIGRCFAFSFASVVCFVPLPLSLSLSFSICLSLSLSLFVSLSLSLSRSLPSAFTMNSEPKDLGVREVLLIEPTACSGFSNQGLGFGV